MSIASEPQPELGRALRLLRAKAEMTQEELGFKAEIHATSISRIECGHNNPSWGTVRKMMTALDATWVELGTQIDRMAPE